MPDRFDPDERFKLDMEPEDAIRKFLGDVKKPSEDDDNSEEE